MNILLVIKRSAVALAIGSMAAASSVSLAAPGKLSQVPLVLPETVQSNLFILFDDSISMASEVLPNPNSTVLTDIGSNNLIDAGVLDFTPDLSGGVTGVLGSLGGLNPAAAQLLNLCVGNNLLAFDRTQTYTPWRGVDSEGVPFGDQNPVAARLNPYAPDSFPVYGNVENTRDITSNIFIDQTVTDCSGIVGTDAVAVSALSAAEQQNYANWFSYYRRREFVIKRALSEVIWESPHRLGLATVANNRGLLSGQPVGIEVATVDTADPKLTAAELATAVANRDERLQQLFEVDMNQGLLIDELLKTVDPVQLLIDLLNDDALADLLNELLIGRLVGALGEANALLTEVQQTVLANVVVETILNGLSDTASVVTDNVNGVVDIINSKDEPCVPAFPLGLNCLLGVIINNVLSTLDTATGGLSGDLIDDLRDELPTLPTVPDLDLENIATNLVTDVLSGQILNQVGLNDILFDAGGRGAPIRTALLDVANYFSGAVPAGVFSQAPAAEPILPADEGGVCQQNFTMVVTDGVWTGRTNPGVANADGDLDTAFDGRSYADPYEETLADVAMELYENDLRPDLADRVSTSVAVDDLNKAQHLVTQAVGFGLRGTDFIDNNPPVNRDIAYPWTNPEPNAPLTGLLLGNDSDSLLNLVPLSPLLELLGGILDAASEEFTLVDNVSGIIDQLDPTLTRKRVDDLRHAAWNGRGKYTNAFNAQELIDAIETIELDIQVRGGSLAEAAVSNNDDATSIYQTAFDSAFYNGLLTKRNLVTTEQIVDEETVTTVALSDEVWEAGALLEARDLIDRKRNIFTHDGSAGVRTGGTEFCWPAMPGCSSTLSVAQQQDLLVDYDAGFGSQDEWANALVNYLVGFHDNEVPNGGPFRWRGGNRLGDLVHSSAVFVGKPQPNYPGRGTPFPDGSEGFTPLAELTDGQADPLFYSTFVANQQNREPLIYTGANDGMLHAFTAGEGNSGGEEVFAYMPGFLFSDEAEKGLHYLADPDYLHRYYVDATPVIADVFLDGEWRTVAVGVAGAGGNGLYALDITDADSGFSASDVLFEFTHPQLGAGLGQPSIARIAEVNKWAIILPNGYSDGTPGTDGQGSGTAQLMIIYLDGSNLDNPLILDTGAGSVVNNDCLDAASNCNGLSTPIVIDNNGDGNADIIYAGDLLGNLWSFVEPVNDGTLNWQVANNGLPLFVARDAGGNIQPITTRPSATRLLSRPEFTTEPNLLVYFGSGQYVTDDDQESLADNSFYAVWDTGSEVPGGATARSSLHQRTITTSADGLFREISNDDFEYVANAVNGIRGWFFDIPVAGERFVAAPLIQSDVVLFNSLLPSPVPCEFSGSGFLHAADAKTGKPPRRVIFRNGANASDNNTAGQAVTGLPSRTIVLGDSRITSTSTSTAPAVEQIEELTPTPSARQSWRDVESR